MSLIYVNVKTYKNEKERLAIKTRCVDCKFFPKNCGYWSRKYRE